MADLKFSRFLTIWFTLDAILNGVCGIGYFLFPAAFFAGIGGPFGSNITPNLIWTVRTQASYFLLASGGMTVAARYFLTMFGRLQRLSQSMNDELMTSNIQGRRTPC